MSFEYHYEVPDELVLQLDYILIRSYWPYDTSVVNDKWVYSINMDKQLFEKVLARARMETLARKNGTKFLLISSKEEADQRFVDAMMNVMHTNCCHYVNEDKES